MDALSEALGTVRMTSAVFFNVQCTAPWGLAVPPLREFAHMLAPGTQCLLGFCLITEGKACFQFEGVGDVPVSAGDIVIKPHGDPHTVNNGAPSQLIDSARVLERILAGDLSAVRLEGGGETTEFVCGYFGCERHAARLFLAGLPTMIKINVRNDVSGQWLESSIRHLLGEAASGRPGCAALLSKMADALFIEALRRYMEQLPQEANGWLAGARDPVVGAALALMIGNPAIPGQWPSWRPRPAPRGPSLPTALDSSSASLHLRIWRGGGCSSQRGCCRPPRKQFSMSRWMWATNRRPHLTAPSSASSAVASSSTCPVLVAHDLSAFS